MIRDTRGRGGSSRCDRCGLAFNEGYQWTGLGIPVVLCKECAEDLEESVWSYGEDKKAAERRFLERLRQIGT